MKMLTPRHQASSAAKRDQLRMVVQSNPLFLQLIRAVWGMPKIFALTRHFALTGDTLAYISGNWGSKKCCTYRGNLYGFAEGGACRNRGFDCSDAQLHGMSQRPWSRCAVPQRPNMHWDDDVKHDPLSSAQLNPIYMNIHLEFTLVERVWTIKSTRYLTNQDGK